MTYSEILIMVMDSISISVVLTFFSMVITCFYKKFKHEPIVKPVRTTTFFLYLYMLFYVTVFRGGLFQGVRTINLIPFDNLLMTTYYQINAWGQIGALMMFSYNVLGNILWFVPLGVLGSTLFKDMNLYKTIMISFVLSFSIEVMQYLFYTGISDVDDLIFNCIGGICGYYIYQSMKMKLVKG